MSSSIAATRLEVKVSDPALLFESLGMRTCCTLEALKSKHEDFSF